MAGQELNRDPVEQILSHIQNGQCFVLNGGAGSGKTYSLVQVLRQIKKRYPAAGTACITFTNAAAIEIRNRTSDSDLLVSTIHEFLWSEIKQFPRQLRETVLELAADSEYEKLFPLEPADRDNVPEIIEYKEYTKLSAGCVSHDQVLALADRMYGKYPRLCDILIDKYRFILVDEYQDTSPHVVNILLNHLQSRSRRNIIGFFGDAMQAIHQNDVDYFQTHFRSANVQRVEKPDNRRNPKAVIDLANKIRTDGLVQKPSDDPAAPNMEGGKVKEGSARFLYSTAEGLDRVRDFLRKEGWDFGNSAQTKDLRLTHQLIANEAGFEDLLRVYDKDPVHGFLRKHSKELRSAAEALPGATFEAAAGKAGLSLPTGSEEGTLFDHVKDWTWEKARKIYMNKDDLLADRALRHQPDHKINENDALLRHLFRIQDLMLLYEAGDYYEVIHRTDFKITRLESKAELRGRMEALKEAMNGTIGDVIDCANSQALCLWDDTLVRFMERNEYLCWRVRQLGYAQFRNLYNYQEGANPLSTQHKIKGQEFDKVLLILDNGKWSQYNFRYLLDPAAARGKSERILDRTKKLFYVCCTRAKEDLVVYYQNPFPGVLAGAKDLFGEANCIDLDALPE